MSNQTDLGAVQIRNEVIASIAALAAKEVTGVVGIWQAPWFARWVPAQSGGVRVEIQEQEARLWLNLVVEYGVDLPQVAVEVQDRVREMVEQMSHLSAAEVHVSIHQIKAKRS